MTTLVTSVRTRDESLKFFDRKVTLSYGRHSSVSRVYFTKHPFQVLYIWRPCLPHVGRNRDFTADDQRPDGPYGIVLLAVDALSRDIGTGVDGKRGQELHHLWPTAPRPPVGFGCPRQGAEALLHGSLATVSG
jgi:hypothetical protein